MKTTTWHCSKQSERRQPENRMRWRWQYPPLIYLIGKEFWGRNVPKQKQHEKEAKKACLKQSLSHNFRKKRSWGALSASTALAPETQKPHQVRHFQTHKEMWLAQGHFGSSLARYGVPGLQCLTSSIWLLIAQRLPPLTWREVATALPDGLPDLLQMRLVAVEKRSLSWLLLFALLAVCAGTSPGQLSDQEEACEHICYPAAALGPCQSFGHQPRACKAGAHVGPAQPLWRMLWPSYLGSGPRLGPPGPCLGRFDSRMVFPDSSRSGQPYRDGGGAGEHSSTRQVPSEPIGAAASPKDLQAGMPHLGLVPGWLWTSLEDNLAQTRTELLARKPKGQAMDQAVAKHKQAQKTLQLAEQNREKAKESLRLAEVAYEQTKLTEEAAAQEVHKQRTAISAFEATSIPLRMMASETRVGLCQILRHADLQDKHLQEVASLLGTSLPPPPPPPTLPHKVASAEAPWQAHPGTPATTAAPQLAHAFQGLAHPSNLASQLLASAPTLKPATVEVPPVATTGWLPKRARALSPSSGVPHTTPSGHTQEMASSLTSIARAFDLAGWQVRADLGLRRNKTLYVYT